MSIREGAPNVEELLRSLGEEPLLEEAERLNLSPRNRRLRCPFQGCVDKGNNRERDAQLYAGKHPRIFCFRCDTKGDLIDLLQISRGFTQAEAIAHLSGTPVSARPPPQLRVVSPAAEEDDAGKLKPAEVRRLWDGMAKADDQGIRYLEGRGLDGAVEKGLVRFATEQHPDKGIAAQARRGYRIAVLLLDVVGNPRGIQLRRSSESRAREPKILSVKGSASSRSFFGQADEIEASPIIGVAEGLADTLALAGWVNGHPGVAVVGAAGKGSLPRLAEALEASGIPLTGKLFALFPQNDRPKNASRREFTRLGQLLLKLGARVAWEDTDQEFKDLAELLHARPDLEWPPPKTAKAILPEPGDDAPREQASVIPSGCAVPIPAQIRADNFAQNFTTLCALIDDPMHREPIAGPGDLTWCEMTQRVRIAGREIADTDLSSFRLGLESQARSTDGKPLKFTEDDIAKSLSMLSRRKTVHPVRDWLSGLKWDGKERLQLELPQVLGQAADSFAGILLTRWMISLVARAMQPGCKVDTVLVLVGKQGVKKSSFFGALAGDWFTDSPVNVGDKDGKLIMRRAWIVEWAELDAMRRARDQEAIKAFLSSRVDMFRKPYGHDVIEAPRHCVIVGTTNNREFLYDTTGNRRFWPVEAKGRIDIAWVAENRAQLCAEALERYRLNEQWWLTEEEEEALEQLNLEHEVGDVWGDPLSDFMTDSREFVTIPQVLKEAIGKDIEHQTKHDEMRVANILKQLGWVPSRRRIGGQIRRVYVRCHS